MRPISIIFCLLICLSFQNISAQKLQLLGLKGALGFNADEGQVNPYVELGVLGYLNIGKRFGIMPELGLRIHPYRYQSRYSNYPGIQLDYYILSAKANFIYSLSKKKVQGLPTFFVSAGLSYSHLLYTADQAGNLSEEFTGWLLFSPNTRFFWDPYIGFGVRKQISSRIQLMIHPEISRNWRVSAFRSTSRYPWEAQLNVSCMWKLN